MKRKIIISLIFSLFVLSVCLTGCRESDKVSHNLSLEADNFNDVRQVTVINCLQGDVLFQMTGKMSIRADTEDNQLEIIVEDNGTYVKHLLKTKMVSIRNTSLVLVIMLHMSLRILLLKMLANINIR